MNIKPYIFKGAEFNKINGFNGSLMHYRDSQCPVPPPSYVYLLVSLMGLVHWGVQDTVKYGMLR